MTGFWYLATPYTGHTEKDLAGAYEDAARAVAMLMTRGIVAFSPIVHSHPVAELGGIDPRDHAIWMPLDKTLMDSAVGLVVVQMPGWRTSTGVTIEIDEFRKAEKPIMYLEWIQ